jgi:tetratricopeptide (TPR) repeat protein
VPFLLLFGAVGAYVGLQFWASHHFRAAQQALERRHLDEARGHLTSCLKVWPRDAEVYFLLARTARRAEAFDEAERYLARCKELGWVEEATSLEKALAQVQRGHVARLEGYLHSCVQKDHPDAAIILEALAEGYLKTFQLPKARICLDQLIERQPENAQALVWRGETLLRLHRNADALADFRQALTLDPERADVRLRLAELLLERQQAAEALRHYEWLHEQKPADRAVRLGLARCYARTNRVAEAIPLLDKLLAELPDDAVALTERGKAALQVGPAEEAEKWLRRAVELAPYDREAVYNLLQCLEAQNRQEEAARRKTDLDRIDADQDRLKELTKRIAESPGDAALRCEAGQILLRNGLEQEGLRWLASALELDPHQARVHRALADYFEKTGRKEEAAVHRRAAER